MISLFSSLLVNFDADEKFGSSTNFFYGRYEMRTERRICGTLWPCHHFENFYLLNEYLSLNRAMQKIQNVKGQCSFYYIGFYRETEAKQTCYIYYGRAVLVI